MMFLIRCHATTAAAAAPPLFALPDVSCRRYFRHMMFSPLRQLSLLPSRLMSCFAAPRQATLRLPLPVDYAFASVTMPAFDVDYRPSFSLLILRCFFRAMLCRH